MGLRLPEFLREPFSAAMSQSTLLTAFIALFGVAAAIFLVGIATSSARQPRWEFAGAAGDNPGPLEDLDDPALAAADTGPVLLIAEADFDDDDRFLEIAARGGRIHGDPVTKPRTARRRMG